MQSVMTIDKSKIIICKMLESDV